VADEHVAELVRGATAGDQASWDALVARYEGMVWGIVRAHRLRDADAHDVFQTTWLRLVEHLDSLRDPRAVGSWLAITVKRECWRITRRTARTTPTDDHDLDALEVDDAPPPGTALLTDERDRALWAALDTLREQCRVLLRMLVADPPPSYEAVSAALAMPVGSIGPTRRRCLEALRARLQEWGITPEASPSG
jgi:RNA polymerase sigma factor (sigma-70 family)